MSTFIKEISDYFQDLAEKHVDILHAAGNVAFCRMDDEAAFAQLRNNAAKNLVLVESFYGKAVGEFDEAMVRSTIVLKFSCYSKTVTTVDITASIEKSFSILLDFWIRMRKDFEDDNCAWLKWVDWHNLQFDTIEQPWLQNHYGWDLMIPYKTHLPEYNAAKWNE